MRYDFKCIVCGKVKEVEDKKKKYKCTCGGKMVRVYTSSISFTGLPTTHG